jgi:hypothetical protein
VTEADILKWYGPPDYNCPSPSGNTLIYLFDQRGPKDQAVIISTRPDGTVSGQGYTTALAIKSQLPRSAIPAPNAWWPSYRARPNAPTTSPATLPTQPTDLNEPTP